MAGIVTPIVGNHDLKMFDPVERLRNASRFAGYFNQSERDRLVGFYV